jgi:WD40 repeat protein
LLILRGHTRWVNAVSITPDGQKAISGSHDKTCILWDLVTGKVLHILRGHSSYVTSVSITPDGQTAISGSLDSTCILWDLQNGDTIHTLKGHNATVNAVSITADGQRAISGSDDNTCILWDLGTRRKLACFTSSSSISSVRICSNVILIGCLSGEVVIVKIDKNFLCPGAAITTTRKIWDFELQQYLPLSADCPICGYRFSPPVSVLATIEEITKKAGLKPEQSPCLEFPDEAWEDPGLLGNCPKCGGELKFNPFIAGGDN